MSASDAWRAAREALLDGGSVCLLGDPRFCPDADADLDPHIQKLVDRQHRGVMPTSSASAESLGRLARASYRGWWQREPDGQEKVLARVQAVWEAPTVTVRHDGVHGDLGLAPGPFLSKAKGPPRIERSDAIAGEHVRAEVIGARLRDLQASHPDAARWVLHARVPVPGGEPSTHEYTLDRGRLTIRRSDRPGGVYLLEPADVDALAAGSVSVEAVGLRWCDPSVADDC